MNTSETSKLNLTSCQERAKAEIETWLLNPSLPEFILSGGAGVGKSTLLDLILKDIDQVNDMCELLAVNQRLHEVLFSATTNKAASVIDGETIYALLGISIYTDYKTGEVKYNMKNATPRVNCLIVVDEASMVGERILKEIRLLCSGCKVLYVGDKNQLHPVGLNFSPVFDSGSPSVHMTTQCRQDTKSHLYDVISDVQKWVETGIPCQLRAGPGVTYVNDIGLVDFIENPGFNDKMVCYTNDTCVKLNGFVRFKRGLPTDFFTEGEQVMSNTTTVPKGKVRHKRILTDAQYTISSIEPEKTHFGMFTYRDVLLDGIPASIPINPIEFAGILKKLKLKKDWRTYSNLKEGFVDLRDAYAITVHKSQGSTYERVLINLSNFKRCPDKAMLARLLYVAISRARTEVFLYGEL